MIESVSLKPDKITGREEVVVLPVFKGAKKLDGVAQRLAGVTRAAAERYLDKRMFPADLGETLLVGSRRANITDHVLLLGLGERKKLSPETVADAAGAASKTLAARKFKTASLLLGDPLPGSDSAWFLEAFVKGFALAQYQFSLNQKPPRPSPLKRLHVLAAGDKKSLTASARRALVTAEHTARVRDLVNTPGNKLTPAVLADRVQETCKEYGIDCRIMGVREMKKEKMGAILSVARGSVEEPRFVVMHYNKARKKLPLICLVGKGVTFDSGGISLKSWERMNEMKGDMAGAAVVIEATAAAARLELPLQLVTIVPAVENLPGGSAFKPGDVVTTYEGKTIEVLSTDAEGRLILADAITYARKHYKPDVVVDFATLTGSVLIALGTRISGVLGNSQDHVDKLVAAGKKAGEPVWQLPLDDAFYKSVEGDITDYKNYSGRNGSTITAAALLGKFAGEQPWVHVDIAGTFWNEGGPSYFSKGATGYGLDLAVRFLDAVLEN